MKANLKMEVRKNSEPISQFDLSTSEQQSSDKQKDIYSKRPEQLRTKANRNHGDYAYASSVTQNQSMTIFSDNYIGEGLQKPCSYQN